jgi:hypothetical protein
MAQVGVLSLDYVDINYALYSRDDALFPTSGTLWGRPYCWSEAMTPALQSEFLQARFQLPPGSPLMPLLEMVADYTNASDAKMFLKEYPIDKARSDAILRFFGYQALHHGLTDISVAAFQGVGKKGPKDFLAMTLAFLRSGQLLEAETILDQATRQPLSMIEFRDAVIQQGLLNEIQNQRPLKLFTPEYFADLTSSVGESALSQTGEAVTIGTFCENTN